MFAERVPLILFFALVSTCNPEPAEAGGPELTFDFASTAECRDVTADYDGDAYPDEKIVELNLRISVHLLSGNMNEVEELRIELGDCDSRIRVHSFAPTTTLESSLSEDIQWTKTVESGNSLGASLGGEAPVVLGETVAHVTPTVNGGLSNREVVTEKQIRVAPRQVVVVSGTINKAHGAFFKLRPTPQTTLEGVHEITVRFIVPDQWRGDSLRVCCQATGRQQVLWMKQQTTWARLCAPVAIYLAGDREAREAALSYVNSTDRS